MAFRVTVPPVLVTYATSSPARSTAADEAFVSSTYSSDAEAPPVTTSAISSPVDGGHATATCTEPSVSDCVPGEAIAVALRTRMRTAAAAAAIRARAIEDLRAGDTGGG